MASDFSPAHQPTKKEYKVESGRSGSNVVKDNRIMGGWESDNVFVIHTDQMEKMQRDQISATFENDGLVTIQIAGATLTGQLEA